MSEEKIEEKEEKKEEGSKSATIEDVKTIVKEAIDDVKNFLTSSDNKSGSGDGTDGSKKDEKESGGPRSNFGKSLAAKEQEAEELVKNAVREVLGELEPKKEEKKEEPKKQETQNPPIKVRRLTKFMLGKDYGKDE